MTRSRIVTAASLAATLAASLVGAGQASAATSVCSYDPGSGIATLQMVPGGGGLAELEFDGQTLKWFDNFTSGTCNSPGGQVATKQNTASILFEGNAGIAEDFIVSERGGSFLGGKTGGTDPGQIETTVFSGKEDTVDIVGTDSLDYIQVTGGPGTGKQGGVLLNPGSSTASTVKLLSDPLVVRVNALGGGGIVTGAQMFSSPTSMHLDLKGGSGRDNLTGGLLAGDRLQGNDGDDTFNTADGQPGDNITGGAGVDTATIDATDQAFGVEKFTH
jgi:hypothetical protein